MSPQWEGGERLAECFLLHHLSLPSLLSAVRSPGVTWCLLSVRLSSQHRTPPQSYSSRYIKLYYHFIILYTCMKWCTQIILSWDVNIIIAPGRIITSVTSILTALLNTYKSPVICRTRLLLWSNRYLEIFNNVLFERLNDLLLLAIMISLLY